jgi:hypothetical protein
MEICEVGDTTKIDVFGLRLLKIEFDLFLSRFHSRDPLDLVDIFSSSISTSAIHCTIQRNYFWQKCVKVEACEQLMLLKHVVVMLV